MIEYFDNEVFLGQSKISSSLGLEFMWNGDSPIDGINPYDFSAIIRGIIRPPKDGDYTFQIVSDGAVSLEINKSIELDHFLSDRNKGVGDTPFGKPVKTQKKIHFNAG